MLLEIKPDKENGRQKYSQSIAFPYNSNHNNVKKFNGKLLKPFPQTKRPIKVVTSGGMMANDFLPIPLMDIFGTQ